MVVSSSRSLLNSAVQSKTIPIVENHIHFAQVLHLRARTLFCYGTAISLKLLPRYMMLSNQA